MNSPKLNRIFKSLSLLLLAAVIFPQASPIVSGQEEEESETPIETINTIRTLLNNTINEYETKNYTGAADLADIAYIDNFEFIEEPLEEQNEEWMEETEVMLREDLSNLIKNEAPINEVTDLITDINKNLDESEKLLNSTSD